MRPSDRLGKSAKHHLRFSQKKAARDGEQRFRLGGVVTEARAQTDQALPLSDPKRRSHAEELARFNLAAVDRELRIIGIKREVNDLCQRQGEAARYPLELEQRAPSPTAPPSFPVLRDQSLVPLASVLCTEELTRRPPRPLDYETENRALVELAQALADSPHTIFRRSPRRYWRCSTPAQQGSVC